jgi:hypothetical protein
MAVTCGKARICRAERCRGCGRVPGCEPCGGRARSTSQPAPATSTRTSAPRLSSSAPERHSRSTDLGRSQGQFLSPCEAFRGIVPPLAAGWFLKVPRRRGHAPACRGALRPCELNRGRRGTRWHDQGSHGGRPGVMARPPVAGASPDAPPRPRGAWGRERGTLRRRVRLSPGTSPLTPETASASCLRGQRSHVGDKRVPRSKWGSRRVPSTDSHGQAARGAQRAPAIRG